jgi:multicomponent Na+:H+ antiporter subunit G
MIDPTGTVLVWAGVLACVASTLGAVALGRDLFIRLHLTTVANVLGLPLVVLGVALRSGSGFAAAEVLVIGALATVSAPALTSAIGRAAAQEVGVVPVAGPE